MQGRRCDGTGLGLSIVKALVGLHGGELTFSSRIGAGTRVLVRLPLDCGSARPKPVAPIKPFASIARLATPAEAAGEAATTQVKKRA